MFDHGGELKDIVMALQLCGTVTECSALVRRAERTTALLAGPIRRDLSNGLIRR
jgi:hypothetical protein